MGGSDERQTQDERTRGKDPAEDVREEFTTYREVDPGRAKPEEADARREADLQPGPTRETDGEAGGEADGEAESQDPSRRSGA